MESGELIRGEVGFATIWSELFAARQTLQCVLARVETVAGDAPGRSKDLLKAACHKIDAMLAGLHPVGRLDATQWSDVLAGVTVVIRHLKDVLNDSNRETWRMSENPVPVSRDH